MSLTVENAVLAHIAMSQIVKQEQEKKLFFLSSVRMRISGNMRNTRPVFDDFNAKRNDLIKKLGIKIDGAEEYSLPIGHANRAEFDLECRAMLGEVVDFELRPIEQHELAGVNKQEFDNPNADAAKQNQIPLDIIIAMQDCGLLRS